MLSPLVLTLVKLCAKTSRVHHAGTTSIRHEYVIEQSVLHLRKWGAPPHTDPFPNRS